ncbi:hypothetical protein FA13DRAFT_880075 [Coprinellus micaceus]|uniref:Uncharacterized protein n=1 Tax=Coprinellus micaceus TaxID=71717 RepID=A0A4Y7RZ96_COPMI|nr:hypothetical protein FA13DRAFT_880075 [Coprinellus micaceus]
MAYTVTLNQRTGRHTSSFPRPSPMVVFSQKWVGPFSVALRLNLTIGARTGAIGRTGSCRAWTPSILNSRPAGRFYSNVRHETECISLCSKHAHA